MASYDLTQLIGFNFNGIEINGADIANNQDGNTDPSSVAYVPGSTTYNITANDWGFSNQSDDGNGPNNVEELVTAASNGTNIDGTPLANPLALGQIVLVFTDNGSVFAPETFDVLGFSTDGTSILIGASSQYNVVGIGAYDPYGGATYIISNMAIDTNSPTAPYQPPKLTTFTTTNAYTGGPFFEAGTAANGGDTTPLVNVGTNADVVSVTNALLGVAVPANTIVQAANSTVKSTGKTGVTYSGYIPANPPVQTTPFAPDGDGGYILHTTVGFLSTTGQSFTLATTGQSAAQTQTNVQLAGQPLLQLGSNYFYVVGFNTTQILLQGASSAGVANTSYYALSNSNVPPTNATSDLAIQFQNYGPAPIVGQAIPCFLAGTRIATPSGEVAVEVLKEGDLVTTVSGEAKQVIWVGSAIVDPRRHADPDRVRPVRIAAGTFGPGAPSRDLFLSPDHAVFVVDMLVPIKELLNGTTIRQVDMGVVTYYHVELAQHDVLLADGLPAESYLDSGCRGALQGTQVVAGALGEPDRNYMVWESLGYRPLTVSGSALATLRERLGLAARVRMAS